MLGRKNTWGAIMKSVREIARVCANASIIPTLLLGGCCMPSAIAPAEGARMDLVINELKKQITNIGQYDIKFPPSQSAACGPTLKAVPAGATISLKTAVNT